MENVRRKKSDYFRLFGKTYKKSDSIIGIAFVLPAVIMGFIFIVLPIIVSLSYAFTDANLLKLDKVKFVFLDNFKEVFNDAVLKKAFLNTIKFVVEVVPLQLLLATCLALILNSKIKCNTFFRWAFFCPVMLSLAVTSMLWMNLLNEQDGLINAMFEAIGLSRQKFLNDPKQAMDIIVIISAWQGAGYQMLIILAAMKNVPTYLYEAASLDGANSFRKFISITLPSIAPTFSFVIVTMTIGAFRLITQPMIMTSGGPVDSTMTMSYYIYKQGITYRDVGYSSAIALIYTIFMSIVAFSIRRIFERKEEDVKPNKKRLKKC